MIDFEVLSAAIKGCYASNGRLAEFAHIQRVAAMAEVSGDRAAALLHDVVEDGLLNMAEIRLTLGTVGASDQAISVTVEAVNILTRREGEPYDAYIERVIGSGSKCAVRVKQLDILDHLNPYRRAGLRPSLASRYLAALPRLMSHSLQEAPR